MSNFKVVVRVRPISDREKSKLSQPAIERGDDSSIIVHNVKLESKKSILADSRCRKKRFYFDRIFWSADPCHIQYASQKTVYDDLSPELLDHVFGGYNVCLLAYGQTGSGKTYTMMGNEENPGFIPRLCEGIFDKISQSLWQERASGETVSFNVSASYIEIYNEKVYDLLEPPKDHGPSHRHGSPYHHRYRFLPHRRHHHHQHLHDLQKHLRVREHPKTGPYVEGLSQHTVKDNLSIQKLIKRGNLSRKTASTRAHNTSSRSHAIFSITFTRADLDADHPMERRSKINLVDLAGSERADSSSEVDKLRMKEGSDINKSLATLGSVIQALAQRSLLLTWSIPSFSPLPSSKSPSPCPQHRRSNNSVNKLTCSDNDTRRHKHVYVPYRDSTLTWILKDSLEGNAVSVMIAAVSPSSCSYFETINTLYYGQRAKTIVNKPVVNEDPVTKLIGDLKAEIKRLKALLSDQQNHLVLDDHRPRNTTTSFCQVDTSSSPLPATAVPKVDLSEQLRMDENKVDVLTRDFLEKWRRMEDVDVEVNPLNRSTVEIFTNVPHLISMQEDGDDDDNDEQMGIKIFKLHVGDTIINLSEIVKPEDEDYDDDDDVDDDYESHAFCVFRNQNNVITILPPVVSSSSPTTPPPLPSYPPPPSSSPPPLSSSSQADHLDIAGNHSPSPTSRSHSSSSSSSFKVYVNDVLIIGPHRPKQGDVIRFGKRLKFKFVNPYMAPRKTKRRRRSLVTSHKNHPEVHGFLSISSPFLRCSSLTSMPIAVGKRRELDCSTDFEHRGDIGFSNVGDRSCLSDLLVGEGSFDGDLTPTLSLTWPNFPGDLVSHDGNTEARENHGPNSYDHTEDNSQFRSEMELQISALEKAWSTCLEKEAELRVSHENNKKDIDRRLAALHTREETLKSALQMDHQMTLAENLGKNSSTLANNGGDQSSRNLPKAIEAVENQLELEKEAILRLERDYRERDERMCEEVGSMHQQIEMLKAQLESLTSKSSDKDVGFDRLSRGFFLQQINSDHDQFQRPLLSSSLCSSFSSKHHPEFNSALDIRSSQMSRLSKSLDSMSVASCDDSLEQDHSSFEALSSYAPFLLPSSLNGMNPTTTSVSPSFQSSESLDPKPAKFPENKQIVESGNPNACIANNPSFVDREIDDDPKLKFAKRLSPVGSEYDHLNEFSDLMHLVDSPKSLPSVEVITDAGTFTHATITPATLDSMFSVPNVEKIVRTDPGFGARFKSAVRPVHENDSDFSDFSTDSLDHKSRPLTKTNPVPNFQENISLETENLGLTNAAFMQNVQNSDSKGDSGADCSSSGSTTGDGNNGKDDELDLERTICAADGAFSQYFAGEDDDDERDDDRRDKITTSSVISVEDRKKVNETLEGKNSDALENLQEVLAASSVSGMSDVPDWESLLNRVSLPQMPLRSLKSLEKNKMKSGSTNSLKTTFKGKSVVPERANLDVESSIAANEKRELTESTARITNNENVDFETPETSPTSLQTTDEPGPETTNDMIANTAASLPTVDSIDLFLGELNAELEKYDVNDEAEDKVNYFLRGDKLVSVVPRNVQSLSLTDNSSNHENNILKVEAVRDGEIRRGFDSNGNNKVSEGNLKQIAANYISYIFKSLESKIDNTALKNYKKQIESPKDFNRSFLVQTDSNFSEFPNLLADPRSDDLPRVGSGNGKHVRFDLNKMPGLANENVIHEVGDTKTFDYRPQLDKRSSLSMGNLSDTSDGRDVEMSHDDKRSLNFKRLSEDNISTGRSFMDLNDFELGRDGRMRIKKHKKRPNLMEIDFVHNESTSTDSNKEDILEDDVYRCAENNFDTFSKNSIASNDSGVSSFSNESLAKTVSTNSAFEEGSYSVDNVELLSDNSISSQVIAPQIGPGVAAPLSDQDYKEVESKEGQQENKSQKLYSTFTTNDLNLQSLLDYSAPLNENYESTFKPSGDQSLEKEDHSPSAAYSSNNQFSYSKSPRNSSDVDAALSDNGSFGNVSVSCDGTESGDSDFKCEEDAGLQDKDCIDDIYKTIQMYQSAVAKAEELITGKFSTRKNEEIKNGLTDGAHLSTYLDYQTTINGEDPPPKPYLDYQKIINKKEEQCIHNTLAKETYQNVTFKNQNNSDDNKQDERIASGKTRLPRVDHKGVSCDLTERQFNASQSSEDRQFYYDKTEVLGFDCYPPMESFHFNTLGPNPKVVNLVMGGKTQLCYPTESSQDKQFEYFGLQPIQEHFEPTFAGEADGSLDDTLVASVLVEEPQDSEISDLVRCSYSIEIKPNVVTKKEIFNGYDEEFMGITKDFSEETSLVKGAEESEGMDSVDHRARKTTKVSFSNEQPTTEGSSAIKYPPPYLQQKEFDDFNDSWSDKNADRLSYELLSESDKLARESTETQDLSSTKLHESFNSDENTELDAKAEISVIPTIEQTIYLPSNHSLTEIQGQTFYNLVSSELDGFKGNVATAPSRSSVDCLSDDFWDSQFASSESTNGPVPRLNVVIPGSPEKPKYVSELKIFLDSANNRVTPNGITSNAEVKLFNSSSKSAEMLFDFSSLPEAQSGLTDQRMFQSTSNLTAMSHLSKSDEDLLGEDSKLFEGLMPNYKELPSSLSGTSRIDRAERLHSNVVRGALDDFHSTGRNIPRVDHDETYKEFLNTKSRDLSFPVYDETVDKFQIVNNRDSSRIPVERKHSTSLGDLRSPEHKAKRQGTYDSIDSITLVLVDPDVDEVCGRETRQFLNGHSSLKNVSQYDVGIQSIVDDSKENLLYDYDDDDENTIEAPLIGEEPSEDEEMGSRELNQEMNGSGDYNDDDRDDVKCFVLNEDDISEEEEEEADLLGIADDRGESFKEIILRYRDDSSVGSLKEFSHVLESSAPVKDDSQMKLLHHSRPMDDKHDRHLTPLFPGREESHVVESQQLDRCFSTDVKDAKTSSHISVFINDPQNTHVSVYDTTFRNSRECLSVANIRQFADSPPSYNRTIETQTYPERRVIETQTSPISQRKTLDLSDNSQSAKPTEDVVHHIRNAFTDLAPDGSKPPWHARAPRADSLKSSELRDQSFSTETRQATGSESSYPICKNNVSTWVTDSEFSEGILQLATSGRSSKTAIDEDGLNEVHSSHASKKKFKEKSKSPKTDKKLSPLGSNVISPPSYTDHVRISNSMTEVRTCIEDEFEPMPYSGDKVNHLSRSHPMKFFQTVEKRQKDNVFGNGMSTPSNLSTRRSKQHVKESSKSSTSRKLWSDTTRHILINSPVHDSGLEDRCTNTPVWLSDRGSTSPGALRGNRSVRDAWTNTEDESGSRRKTHSLSRLSSIKPRHRHDDWKHEINRLKREKRRMIEMLAKQVVPSKVQIELSEAQLNYHLGQTDLYLNLLEESAYPSEDLRASRSHSVDHFFEDGARAGEIFDYPTIRFDQEFLSRHCGRLEASRRKIEERLSNIELTRSFRTLNREMSEPTGDFTADRRSDVKIRTSRKDRGCFASTISSPLGNGRDFVAAGKLFRSHRMSSPNSPHYRDTDDASRRLGKRLFGSDRLDSLHFDQMSDAEESESHSPEATTVRKSGRSPRVDEFGKIEHEFRDRMMSSGRKCRQDGFECSTPIGTSKVASSSDESCTRMRAFFPHGNRRGSLLPDDDDDGNSFRLVADCYEARVRARDEIRKSLEFLHHAS